MILTGSYELFPYSGLRRCFLYPGRIRGKDSHVELTVLISKHAQEVPQLKDLFVFIVKGSAYVKILSWEKEKHGLVTIMGDKAKNVVDVIRK